MEFVYTYMYTQLQLASIQLQKHKPIFEFSYIQLASLAKLAAVNSSSRSSSSTGISDGLVHYAKTNRQHNHKFCIHKILHKVPMRSNLITNIPPLKQQEYKREILALNSIHYY
ncbi:hypothetical protein V8G54_029627 [Vigna mungo]|uniref:Uncharacterized protein n=1 Tax=Vigna mungo TaxID=3915 RepID=A0AAQ3MUW3_VIGMU